MYIYIYIYIERERDICICSVPKVGGSDVQGRRETRASAQPASQPLRRRLRAATAYR